MNFKKRFTYYSDFGVKRGIYWLLVDIWNFISFYRFRKKFIRGIQYFKQGYESHDYDWCYLIDDIVFKMERISKEIKFKDFHVDSLEDVKKIDEIVGLFKLLREDDFEDKYVDEITKVYGEKNYDFEKDPITELFKLKVWREKETPENKDIIKKLEDEAFKNGLKDRLRNKKKVFYELYKNIENWWI